MVSLDRDGRTRLFTCSISSSLVLLNFLFAIMIPTLISAQQTSSSTNYRPAPGLPSNGIRQGSISIGFLPDWSHENPSQINSALGKGMSIIGDYINFSPSDYSFAQISYHLPEVRRIARGSTKAVYAPAFLYGANLNTWTEDMTQGIAQAMKGINQQGVTVWLRLLFEMNGGWMPYGLQPELYATIFRNVTTAVRAVTNNTFMLWSPNVWSGSVSDPTQGYVPYFPGEAFVDIAGLSYYSLGDDKEYNQPPSNGMFRNGFQSFYDLMTPRSGNSNRLNLSQSIPIVISETSAPFYYELPSTDPYYAQNGDTDIAGPLPNLNGTYTPSQASPPYAHSDDELYIKATWFVQMTSNATSQQFPNLQAVSIFNYLKRGGDGTEVLVDFRYVGENQTVENWVRGVIGNQTAYEIGYTGSGTKIGGHWVLAGIGFVVSVAVLA